MAFAVALDLTLGVLAGLRPHSWLDTMSMFLALGGVSFPSVLLGPMLLWRATPGGDSSCGPTVHPLGGPAICQAGVVYRNHAQSCTVHVKTFVACGQHGKCARARIS
jgi:hypothetical protein